MPKFPLRQKIAMVMILLALTACGIWFYKNQENSQRRQVQENLYVIAKLKANQIAEWRRERLADASVLTESPFLTESIAQWLNNPQRDIAKRIQTRLMALQTHYRYDDVLLANPEGQIKLSISGRARPSAS